MPQVSLIGNFRAELKSAGTADILGSMPARYHHAIEPLPSARVQRPFELVTAPSNFSQGGVPHGSGYGLRLEIPGYQRLMASVSGLLSLTKMEEASGQGAEWRAGNKQNVNEVERYRH